MKVIIVNGSGGVGKDTFIKYILQYCSLRNHIVLSRSLIDPIKELAEPLNEYMKNKDEKDRKFLSDLKELTENYCDYPYHDLICEFEKLYMEYSDSLFIAVIREPKDIDRFVTEISRKYGLTKQDIRTVLITSDRVKKIDSNIADASVNNMSYDVTIMNNWDKEVLQSKAHKFIIDFVF